MSADVATTGDKSLEVAELDIERLPLSEVSPHPDNPRLHSPEQIKAIEQSLIMDGYIAGSMGIQRSTHKLYKGHGVYAALLLLGCIEADFVVKDLTDAETLALLARDNALSDMSTNDGVKLKAISVTLQKMETPIERMGYTLKEITAMQPAKPVTEDDPPEVDEVKPVTQHGDLWSLGKHRVLCGDSTKREDVERVMGGEKADMGLTSPPYGVGKEYEAGVSFVQYLGMLRKVADCSLETIKPGGFFFVNFDEIASQSHSKPMTSSNRQCLYPTSKDYWQIFHEERGMDLYAQRIWYKPFNRLQQPFWTYKTSIPHHQEWEHIWTWRLPGGEGDQVYDWDISVRAVWDTRNESTDDRPLTRHVAAFPVGIPGRAIKAHSEAGHIIWEPFCGSGTTLIAAAQLDRICYGLEIAPKYCDVIVKRYINHSKFDSAGVSVQRNGKTLSWEEAGRKPLKVG